MDWRLNVFLLLLCLQNCYGQTDEEIAKIFGTDTTTTSPRSEDCECVRYYQCANHTIITNGEYIIDPRIQECSHYMEICCYLPEIQMNRTRNHTRTIGNPNPDNNTGDNTNTWNCGVRNAYGTTVRLGTEDKVTIFGEFPWMVAVFKIETKNNILSNIYECGGSLIHPQVVMTAAHCVVGRKSKGRKFKIRAGEWDTQTENEERPYKEVNVKTIVVHPRYNPSAYFNDVALLILESELETEDHIDTTCLPPKNFVPSSFDECFVTGWGMDKFGKEGEYSVLLKKVELPIVDNRACETALKKTRLTQRFFLHPSFLCAGGQKDVDVCKGDGGGPLVCSIPGQLGRYHQVGIVSWGIECGLDGVPGVYISVGQIRDWIDEEMDKFNFDKNSYIP